MAGHDAMLPTCLCRRTSGPEGTPCDEAFLVELAITDTRGVQ